MALSARMARLLPTPRLGYCAITNNDPGDCSHGTQGMWSAGLHSMHNIEHCAMRCLQCRRCRFVSFSSKNDDCSWFSSCPPTLHTDGVGTEFKTVEVAGTTAAQWRRQSRRSSALSSSAWVPWPENNINAPTKAPGLCAPTNGEGDCSVDDRGSWDIDKHGLATAELCAERCRKCDRCAVYSFSAAKQHRDCSWYAACDLSDLRRPPPSGADYQTARIRPDLLPPLIAPSSAASSSARVRLAIATLAVGQRMRCGFVRWCESARRLRSVLDPAWSVTRRAARH